MGNGGASDDDVARYCDKISLQLAIIILYIYYIYPFFMHTRVPVMM